MKDTVAKESYVERFAREQKEKMGIPVKSEMGIPSDAEKGIPAAGEKNILGEKEVRDDGKDTRGKGHKAPTE